MINILSRFPIPGSFGAPVDAGVQFHISVTGLGNSVLLPSVVITINSIVAFTASAPAHSYTGTAVTDGLGGWNFDLTPPADFAFDSVVTVQIQCVESPALTPFTQTYSFNTRRDIQLTVNALYTEEGDVLDVGVYVHEDLTLVPDVVSSGAIQTFSSSRVVGFPGPQIDHQEFQNEPGLDATGVFLARFLHPLAVSHGMTYGVQVIIDPYSAPGIGTLTASGDVTFTAKDGTTATSAQQPYTEGEIHRPRIEYEGRYTQDFQVQAADYQVVDFAQAGALPDLLVDLNFLDSYAYAKTLNGSLSYSGGGNRILPLIPDPETYALQSRSQFPPPVSERTWLEPGSTNFFPNSALLGSTSPFTLSGSDTTVNLTQALQVFLTDSDQNPLIGQAYIRMEGMGIYNSTDRHGVISSPKVSYTTGQPVTISTYVRAQFRDDSVTLDNFTLRADFFDSSNLVVFSQSVTADPRNFESPKGFILAEITVDPGSIPGTATKVGFSLDIDSFEACDLLELWLVGPSIEFSPITGSRVVGSGANATRLADSLSLQQPGNFNIPEGRVVITYEPFYSVSPLTQTTLWDSRLPSTLTNGFAAFHRTDGFIEFRAVDPVGTTQTVLSSSPFSAVANQEFTFVFSWNSDTLNIREGSTLIGTFSGSYSPPGGVNSFLRLGSDADGAHPLRGEVHSFQVYSKFFN